MSSAPSRLTLFLDEGVPKSVGNFFLAKGQEVIFHQDALAPRSPDILVAETALRGAAILVAVDKDMRQIAKRHGIGSARFKHLDLLQFRCNEVQSVHRVQEAYSLIVLEWDVAQSKAARRFWVEIGESYIRTHR